MPTAVPVSGEETGDTWPTVGGSLERLQTWSKQGKKPETTGRDGFPQYANDPLASIHQQLDTFLREIPSPGVFQKNNADTLPAAVRSVTPEYRLKPLRPSVILPLC